MIKEVHIPLFDVTICLSNAVDLISPTVFNHHKQVAYIAAAIAKATPSTRIACLRVSTAWLPLMRGHLCITNARTVPGILFTTTARICY